jgi:hypothetical protein
MGALSSTSPIQNAAESPTGPSNDLNDSKITVEVAPKPRKFFKSRNSAPPAEIQQQQMAMQQQQSSYAQQQSYQNHQQDKYPSGEDDEEQSPKRVRKKPAAKKEKVEKPPKPPKPEKVPKPKKEKKVKVKEVAPPPASESGESETETPTPTKRGRNNVEPTRTSGRSRAKCVNYNEDAGEVEFFTRIDRRIVPRHLIPATVTKSEEPEVPKAVETLEVPVPQHSPALHPPIVLRISKVS